MFNFTHTKMASSLFLSLGCALLLTLSQAVRANTAPVKPLAEQNQPLRIISAGAGITELVLALNGEKNVIAIDSSSQLPKGLNHIKQVGYHRMLSAEGLLSLNPDILIGSDVMGPATTLALLRAADVNVISLPIANNKSQLFNNIDTISTVLAKPNQAKKVKNHLSAQLNTIAKNRDKLEHSKPIKVLFLLLQAGRPAKVGGKDSAADIIIHLAGAQNSATFSGYKTVSQEGILSIDPDIILISSRNKISEKQDTSLLPLLSNMPLLANTSAYQNKRIFMIPAKALIGGMGLSAIDEAERFNQQLLSFEKSKMIVNDKEIVK
ncbi:ABC transporter substrate-binding protein [uncultured Shewanella sp.]|uniref:heme/hemin ABC transporter substrate-binding protein n=1 Tax=uncultured Shewanella sp. TaxID=173975 RepID=UPI00260F115C|nr:ABC transporter substrate-binding protein [uncultured Shewanella sp.]